jgi:hypothetical protein
VVWPGKFKPDIISRYNSSFDPIKFLQLNITTIQAARGYWHVMANWFPMAVKGAARAWLMDLALETITLWKDYASGSPLTSRPWKTRSTTSLHFL